MRLLFCVAPLLIGAALVAQTGAQEKENPIVAAVKPHLKDPGRPFTMLVYIKVKDGTAEKFEAAFARALKYTHTEKGNLAYDLNRSAKNPNEFVVYERWQNLAALEVHASSAHIKALGATTGDFRDGPARIEVLLPAGE